jgi:hypothetical protein
LSNSQNNGQDVGAWNFDLGIQESEQEDKVLEEVVFEDQDWNQNADGDEEEEEGSKLA